MSTQLVEFHPSPALQVVLNRCIERVENILKDDWQDYMGMEEFLAYVADENADQLSEDWSRTLDEGAEGISLEENRLILSEMIGTKYEERVQASEFLEGDIDSLSAWAQYLVAAYLEEVFQTKYPDWHVGWWG